MNYGETDETITKKNRITTEFFTVNSKYGFLNFSCFPVFSSWFMDDLMTLYQVK